MEHEPNHLPFYLAGAALVLFALAISALGILRADTFPASKPVRAAVIALCAVLVAAAMTTAVVTA
jgi:hypothetical protein